MQGEKLSKTLIYLDTNVLIEIENQKVNCASILRAIGIDEAVFPYSAAHLQEAKEISAKTVTSRNALIAKRLQTVANVSKDVYLNESLATKKVHILGERPEIVSFQVPNFRPKPSPLTIFPKIQSNQDPKKCPRTTSRNF